MASSGSFPGTLMRFLSRGIAGVVLSASLLTAAEPPPSVQAPAQDATSETAPAAPAQIPAAEVMTQAEAVNEQRHEMAERLLSDEREEALVGQTLVRFEREAARREAEDAAMFSQESPLERLPEMELYWSDALGTLKAARGKLEEMSKRLEAELADFRDREALWQRTREGLRLEAAPRELQERAARVTAEINTMQRELEVRREGVLQQQTELGKAVERVQTLLARVKEERKVVMKGLLHRDRPPIWSPEARTFGTEGKLPLRSQWESLRDYLVEERGLFAVNGALFIFLLIVFKRWQRWARARGEEEVDLKELRRVAGAPICAALLLSVLVGYMLYAQPPRMLLSAMRLATMIPAVVLLGRLIPGRFSPVLYGLVLCFLMDGARGMMVSMPFWVRMLFLVQMGVGALACGWLGLVWRNGERKKREDEGLLPGLIRGAVRLAGVGFLLALLLNALGYGRLSMLGGGALLQSTYLAVVLAGLVAIWDGLGLGLLASPVANRLGMVRRHRELIWERLRKLARAAALLLWAWQTLRFFAVDRWVWSQGAAVLNAKLYQAMPSLLQVIEFVGVIWAAFLLSRLVRFVLEEDIYPRVTLSRGLPYAISTVLHYTVLLAGFFFAVAALGQDLTKVTILAGAFGVGLGFGLQNIVNNFVSGLILLFERPLNVGDVVEVDKEANGVIRRIGIRATTIRTLDGGEVIVPNGKLISDKVVNWTRLKRQRLITIPIPVSSDCNAEEAMERVRKVAEGHEKVASFPRPTVFLTKVDPLSLELELRVWTNFYDDLLEIRSDLATRALSALTEAGIALRKG